MNLNFFYNTDFYIDTYTVTGIPPENAKILLKISDSMTDEEQF